MVLRVWQYFANSSLWLDEAALARNIIDRSPAALVGPLDYAQAAQPAFLLIQKGTVAVLGSSEYALRFFPLLCGIGSLLLFARIAGRLLEGWVAPYAVGLFSLGTPFVYFSSQAKQYSSDVAVALVLLLTALEIRRRGVNIRGAWIFGIIGAVAVWLSQPALFVLAGFGAAFAVLAVMERDRTAAGPLFITWTLWGVSAAAVAALALRNVPALDREYLKWCWQMGFMPMPPQSAADLAWFPRKLIWVFGAFAYGLGLTNGGMNYRWSPVFAAVMAYGFWALWQKRRDVVLFFALPVAVVIVLSAAGLYPFTARQIAFLVPYLLLATAAGAERVLATWPERLQIASPVALALLGGAPVFAAATTIPPFWLQHLRPVVEYVEARRQPGDEVYVFYGAGQAFHYYAQRLAVRTEHVTIGQCGLADPRTYLRDLDQFRGKKRIWIVMTHTQRLGEESLLTDYLDRIGERLDQISVPGSSGLSVEGARGYLYDLSDRTRLALAASETYALTLAPAPASERRWLCYGVTISEKERSAF